MKEDKVITDIVKTLLAGLIVFGIPTLVMTTFSLAIFKRMDK